MARVVPVPLTIEGYAPYGEVIAPRAPVLARSANMGTAERWNFLSPLDNLREGARANVALFRCRPYAARPVPIRLLERHPLSTQMFVPMNARRYLVVVANGGDGPDLATLGVFLATGEQGITYRPGVWHHPLIALDEETSFACVVFEDGTDGDCDVVNLAGDEARDVDV